MKIWTRGHSLLEIIVVLCILSFMLLCGTFAWTLFEKHQMSVFVARFYHTLQLARMQAIYNHQNIEICPTMDFKVCSPHWSEHFMIFNSTEAQCLYRGHIPKNMKITTNTAHIGFHANGEALENGTITLHFGTCTRKLVMITTGRVRVA